MAVELINVGQIANDGTGDDLRTAFLKINNNLEELELRLGERTAATNVGGGHEVFKELSNYELNFRTITAGPNITITQGADTLYLNPRDSLNQLVLVSDSGSAVLDGFATVNVQGGNKINISIAGSTLIVDTTAIASVSEDTNPTLSAALDGDGNDIINVGTIDAENINSLVNGYNMTDAISNLHSFDLGTFQNEIQTIWDWFAYGNDVDFGTFDNTDFRNLGPMGADFTL